MDCREAEEFQGPYLLGALGSRDRWRLESHLDGCRDCRIRLRGEGETVTRLAFTVPPLEVPSHVKQRLLARVDADLQTAKPVTRAVRMRRFWGVASSHPARAAAAVLILGLVLSGLWFNTRLSHISKENAEMTGQLESVAEGEAKVLKMVSDQRYLTSMTAAPGVSVNMLWGTEDSSRAWGMIACCAVSNSGVTAILAVLNLPPLPNDQVYQVWLVKGGQKHSAGIFTVDATGYGQTVLLPVIPFHQIEAIVVTVEPSEGSSWPTGMKVLNGDL